MNEIRLIDANALKKKINAFYDEHFKGLVPTGLIEYAQAVDSFIDNAPTIKPEKKVVDSCDMNIFEPEKQIQTPSCLTNPERYEELLERYKEE